MKFVGLSLDALMLRRITVPPSHTSHDRVSGSAEFVMKHYVYNNFINAESHRVLPNFEIADNQGRGSRISYESRYKVVADELEDISIETGLGWGVTADFKAKKFIFDVYESKDLTPDNRQGNNPVFFSPEYESIESQSFIDNDLGLKNVGYVGGQGEGAERKIVTFGDVSGWDRIETFVDARDVSDEDEETEEELPEEEVERLLIERGKKKMKDMQTVFSLEAKISTPITRKSYEDNHEGYRHPAQPAQGQTVKKEVITPFEYEKDFDLGDRVEVRNLSWDLTMEAPITELVEIYEGSGFKLEATFGRSRPTLISKLKDKFDELEGIEKQEAPEQVSVRRMNEAKEFAEKQDIYVREDAQEFANKAEKKANEYTNEVDTQNREFTNYLMDKANEEIEDTKKRLNQAIKDLGDADGVIKQALEDIKELEDQLDTLPDWSEDIDQINETLKKANDDIDAAQEKIDSVTEDKDGQTVLKGTLVTNELIAEDATLIGSLKGSNATIEDLTTNNMTALNAIIQDAIVKGEFGANEATMLGLTTQEMTAINAIIQDAKITGNLNASDAIFQKGRFDEATIVDAIIENVRGLTGTFADVTVTDGDFNLMDENTGNRYSATPRRNLLRDHSFELIPQDGGSMDSESMTHNWLDIKPNKYHLDPSPWERVRNPKVSITFAPDHIDALAIFGDKAIVVRNSNYVRQYIYEGVGAGSVYTVSGHFKRQWKANPGIPRIEIWHVAMNGDRLTRIINSSFNRVDDDYSVSLHSTTFTVPSSFSYGDSLEVIISGGDDNWVQCDGVQMVEGTRPSVYQPEDSIWEVTKGNYLPTYEQRSLWIGASYPTDDQSITPDKTLNECTNGWLLKWQAYDIGQGIVDHNYQYTIIPKTQGESHGGRGLRCVLARSHETIYKYIYVSHERITGHSFNNDGSNNKLALTEVLEW